jgi:hypothetical protein
MGDRPSRAECCCHHPSLDQLRFRCTSFARVAGVNVDAVWALSRDRDRDRNQFLVLHRNRARGDRCFVEGPKGLHYFGRESIHFLYFGEVTLVIHKRVWVEVASTPQIIAE